jgi:hypothetical protein
MRWRHAPLAAFAACGEGEGEGLIVQRTLQYKEAVQSYSRQAAIVLRGGASRSPRLRIAEQNIARGLLRAPLIVALTGSLSWGK